MPVTNIPIIRGVIELILSQKSFFGIFKSPIFRREITPILTRRPFTTWPKNEVGVQTPLHQRTRPELHAVLEAQLTSIAHPLMGDPFAFSKAC